MLADITSDTSGAGADWLAAFLGATARGYAFADAHPEEAARYAIIMPSQFLMYSWYIFAISCLKYTQ